MDKLETKRAKQELNDQGRKVNAWKTGIKEKSVNNWREAVEEFNVV